MLPAQKILLIFFLLLSLFISVKPISAQNLNNYSQTTQYTDNLAVGLLHTLSCIATGTSVANQPCFTYMQSGSNLHSEGALDILGHALTLMFITPPSSSVNYLAQVGENFGIVKPAHAQNIGGTGNQVINIVLTLWQVSRNISYVVMIIVFVVIGLMVMFRQRLNPQTVITIQAALPGLVVGLVLITFSYFFAALLVDVAFISTWLVGFYFIQTQTTPINIDTLLGENVLSIFGSFTNAINQPDIYAGLYPVLNQILSAGGDAATVLIMFIGFMGCQFGAQITGPLGLLPPPIGGIFTAGSCAAAAGTALSFPEWSVSMFLFVIFVFIMLYSMFMLVLRLINNYLTILLLTFTAPFHFLAASLPGRQGIAVDWARNMLCNVLAFPAVFAAFYFAAYVLAGLTPIRPELAAFQLNAGLPAGVNTMPLFGGIGIDFVRILVAFGVIIATPSIPDALCETIGKVSRSSQILSSGIKAQVGGGRGLFGQTTGAITTAGGIISKSRFRA